MNVMSLAPVPANKWLYSAPLCLLLQAIISEDGEEDEADGLSSKSCLTLAETLLTSGSSPVASFENRRWPVSS